MRKLLQSIVVLLALSALSGCVYQPPMSQGNLLKQEDLDQVEVGMTRSQVRFLLGTPMIDDPFHKDRWDYVYFLKIGRQDASFKRWVSIQFTDDRVSEITEDQELGPDL
ncbi:MAG: outer membrane protein assembly factor BamE [Proteobacteria bacterium]|nr:outer membrane protein assembly factor BamE [Pseudomonadota bacterium]